MARTCQNCYSSVNDEHKFCTKCGKEVPFPEYKETKIEEDNQSSDEIKYYKYKESKTGEYYQSSNEIKYYKYTRWIKSWLIWCLLIVLYNYLLHPTSNSTNSIHGNTNSIQEVLPKVETYESTLEEKSTLFKEAKKDFDTKNYDSSILKFNKLVGLNYKPDEVKFYLGQNWYMKKVYPMAVVYYKDSAVLNDKAAYMPTLLLHSVISFENIKDNENAKSFYSTLIELYPTSNEANIAKKNHFLKNNIKKQNESIIEEKPNLYKESENNSYSKKLESTTSSDKNDMSKNVYSPPEQILPYNGEIRNYSYAEKIAPLNIKTSYGANYLVKLKGAYTKEPIMTIFIIGGNEVTINVPLGSFEITYASGNKWYGYNDLFGKETVYSKADEIFNFKDNGYEISGYTITLYRVSNGNLNTQNISQSQF